MFSHVCVCIYYVMHVMEIFNFNSKLWKLFEPQKDTSHKHATRILSYLINILKQ